MSDLEIGGDNAHLIFGYNEKQIPGVVAFESDKRVSTSCLCISWPHTEYIKQAHKDMKAELATLRARLDAAMKVCEAATRLVNVCKNAGVLNPYPELESALASLSRIDGGSP